MAASACQRCLRSSESNPHNTFAMLGVSSEQSRNRARTVRLPQAWSRLVLIVLLGLVASPSGSRGAGVTIITHGFNSDTDGWVLGMAGQIPGYYNFPGTHVICYRMD